MSDEVMQDLDRLLRTGFTAAAQLAEQHRRGAAEADRQRRDADTAARQAAADHARAVQQAARAHYEQVGWDDWRGNATLADWAGAYQHAHAMRPFDPLAATAHNRIEDEVRRRYRLDIREALELHLQQVAENQRIRDERAADIAERQAAADYAAERGDSPTARAAGPDTGRTPGAAPDSDEPVVVAGQVVTDEELVQARTTAQTAAGGFSQQADDAVRHSRGQATSSRQMPRPARRGASQPRPDADLTRSH